MVYIYKKPASRGKNYYYLRASEKKGNKLVTKDIAYLGSSIEEVKASLDSLTKYKDKIRKSYKIINAFLESNHFLEKVKKLKLKQDIFLKEKTNEVEACKKIGCELIFGFGGNKIRSSSKILERWVEYKRKFSLGQK